MELQCAKILMQVLHSLAAREINLFKPILISEKNAHFCYEYKSIHWVTMRKDQTNSKLFALFLTYTAAKSN